ncbi:MAG: hypothetical protein DI563_02570 [Variovorax paradoxus]|uniref:Uncharacterized protein n=1 Tax=Variovorax paradoxus TaxID=34073 RepID=A0A2W5QS48_VARPD|nr:MAG: hypothetical protein DI563_02570 [Variovorax paradoxus]
MNSFSIWHWIVALFWVAVFIIPGWRIVSKAGFHGGWSLLLLVPLLNVVAIWVFAFVRWPADRTT